MKLRQLIAASVVVLLTSAGLVAWSSPANAAFYLVRFTHDLSYTDRYTGEAVTCVMTIESYLSTDGSKQGVGDVSISGPDSCFKNDISLLLNYIDVNGYSRQAQGGAIDARLADASANYVSHGLNVTHTVNFHNCDPQGPDACQYQVTTNPK